MSLLALPLFALPLPVTAQAGSDEPTLEIFAETIDVRVVHVEAVVTDRDDRRVTGLGPDDFRLLVDGEEAPIDYFSEVRDHRVAAPSIEITTAEPALPAASVALEPEQPAPVRYLVFFDEIFTSGRDRRLMAREIEEHIDHLGPYDSMTLVAFDGNSPEIVVDDSANRDLLRAGLAHLGADRFLRGANWRARREVYTDAFAAFDAAGEQAGYGDADLATRREHLHEVESLVDRHADRVLEALAGSMRRAAKFSPPGRRVLLWVTGAWPIQGSLSALDASGKDRPGERRSDRKERLEHLGRLAGRLGFTIYPVDAPGWVMTGIDQMNQAFGAGTDGFSGIASGTSSFGEQEVHATLETLADMTGGKALLNSFRREALGRVIDDVGSYYWLGFDASWGGDGSEHTIELVPKRRDLEVRSRRGVWATPEEELRHLDTVVARFVASDDEPAAGGGLRVPVELRFPVAELGALPTERGYELQLEVRLVTVDDRGNSSLPKVWPFVLGAGSAPSEGDKALYAFDAILDNATEQVVVTIHDRLGETVFLKTTRLGATRGTT